MDSAKREEGPIAEDAEEPRTKKDLFLGEPRLLGFLGDMFFAMDCLDHRV